MSLWTIVRGSLWELDGTRPPPRVTPRLPARFTPLTPQDLPALVAALGEPETKILRERFAPARQCFGAWIDQNLAAYGWVSRQPEYIGEQERTIKITPDDAYIWDCVTLPKYRGQHLYSALLAHINHTLYQSGVQHIWIGSDMNNKPSLRGFANAGFHPILPMTYLRLFNLRVMWLGTQPNAPSELITLARCIFLEPDEHVIGPIAFRWSNPSTPTEVHP